MNLQSALPPYNIQENIILCDKYYGFGIEINVLIFYAAQQYTQNILIYTSVQFSNQKD